MNQLVKDQLTDRSVGADQKNLDQFARTSCPVTRTVNTSPDLSSNTRNKSKNRDFNSPYSSSSESNSIPTAESNMDNLENSSGDEQTSCTEYKLSKKEER